MSTYYDFMVEAKYKDKWNNIDLHTKDFDFYVPFSFCIIHGV